MTGKIMVKWFEKEWRERTKEWKLELPRIWGSQRNLYIPRLAPVTITRMGFIVDQREYTSVIELRLVVRKPFFLATLCVVLRDCFFSINSIRLFQAKVDHRNWSMKQTYDGAGVPSWRLTLLVDSSRRGFFFFFVVFSLWIVFTVWQ